MYYFLIKIYGIVQGVGFRPFIARLFAGCCGSVKNCGSYVTVLLHYDEKKNILSRCNKESCKNVKENRECAGESSNSIKESLDRADELSECIREQAPERAEIVDIQIEKISKQEFKKLLSLDIPDRITIVIRPVRDRCTKFYVNLLRNIAIRSIRTSHFLILDMDLWPIGRLYTCCY